MIKNNGDLAVRGIGIIVILFGLFCNVIIQNFGLLVLKLTARMGNLNENTWIPILSMLLTMSVLLYITLMYMKKYINLVAPENKLQPFRWKQTMWIFKGYGLMMLAGGLVSIIEILITGNPIGAANQLALAKMANSGLSLKIFLVFLAIILAPLLEEAIFRGVLMNYFLKNSYWWSNVIVSGVAFGLYHVVFQPFQLVALVQYSLTGIILAVVYKKTQSLQYSMSLHCLSNVIVTIVMLS